MYINKRSKITRSPNVILIVMDTARAQNFSCYGHVKQTAPNLEAIASEGVLYENAVSPGIWTLPSHASIFTGLLPSSHGENSVSRSLDHSIPTIAEYLSSRDYLTVGFSKIHFVGKKTGLARGFQQFYEMWKLDPLRENGNILDKLYIKFDRKLENIKYLKPDYGSRRINHMVEKWFSEHHQKDRPFFLFINYFEPHLTYWPPKDYRSRFLEEHMFKKAGGVNQDANAYNAGMVEMSEEDFEILRALYDGEIAYTDYRIGEIVNMLKDKELLDETLLIITSDHGEIIGEHGLMEHRTCPYQPVVHVPLIIRFPDIFPKGRRIKELVQTTDLFPTVCHILGDSDQIEKCAFDGTILPPLNDTNHRYAVTEYVEAKPPDSFLRKNPTVDTSIFTTSFMSVRRDNHKLIWSSDDKYNLFDLSSDPTEERNIAGDEKQAAILSDLRAVVQKQLNKWKDPARGDYSGEMEEEVVKRLEDLGYL